MDMGYIVTGLIIVIDLVIVVAVMRWGTQHDRHTEIRSAESSQVVQMLLSQREPPSKSGPSEPANGDA